MKAFKCLVRLALLGALVFPLHSQQPAAPATYQLINYIRVPQANRVEFEQLVKETSIKTAETRVKDGEIVSWTLLRAVMPAGAEARSDYLISTIFPGAPSEPLDRSGTEALLKKAGVTTSVTDYYARRDKLSSLVSTEVWRTVLRIGNLKKGHYLQINQMKAADREAYLAFERDAWGPVAEALVGDGQLSGWMVSERELPGGTDQPNNFYTVDMFPTWAAMFKPWSLEERFTKAHPGKNIDDVLGEPTKLRTLSKRELWVVVERVAK
jgi:hypothetical protein